MRELTDHKVNGLNDALAIFVTDEPGPGGANHEYSIVWTAPDKPDGTADAGSCIIKFQNGPLKENFPNGISNEALLAIVYDRLRSFQHGQYACETNAHAMDSIGEALAALKARTMERMKRGVEGTMQK